MSKKPESQASYIRSRLAKKASVETILAECEKRFAKGKVTGGYIRWVAKRVQQAKPATSKVRKSKRDE